MHGLYLLWWVQEKHMSPAVVAATLAAGDLAILVLEIPTGWVADRFGHRFSLILGSAVQTAGMLACWLGNGVPGLVGATVLVGIGDCFRSGADQALLYRTCIALSRESEFQRIEARTQAVRLAALVALVLTGGVIVSTLGYAAGWIAESTLAFVGLLIACAMVEPPAAPDADEANAALEPTAALGVNTRALLALMAPAACLGVAASVASFVAQTTGHGAPGEMTVLVAVITVAEAAGSAAAMRVTTAGVSAQQILAALGVAVCLVAAGQPAAFIPAVIALSFLEGAALPLRAAAIQRTIPDGIRARAASLASAFDKGLTTIGLLLAGVWQGHRRRP